MKKKAAAASVSAAHPFSHRGPVRGLSLSLALIALASFASHGLAGTGTWNGSDNNSEWNDTANWTITSGSGFPNSTTTDQAYITGGVSNGADITLGTNIGVYGTGNVVADAGLTVSTGTAFTIDGQDAYTFTLNSLSSSTHNYDLSITNDSSVTFNANVIIEGSLPNMNIASGSTLTFASGTNDTYDTPIDLYGGGTVNLDANINASTSQNVNYVIIDGGTVNWDVGVFTPNSGSFGGTYPYTYNSGSVIVDRTTGTFLNFQTSLTSVATGESIALLNTGATGYTQSVMGTTSGITIGLLQEMQTNTGTASANVVTIGANVSGATMGSPATVTYSGGYNLNGINSGDQVPATNGYLTYTNTDALTTKFSAAQYNIAEFNEQISGNNVNDVWQTIGKGIVKFDGSTSNDFIGSLEVGADGNGSELLLAKSGGAVALAAGTSVKIDGSGASVMLGASNQTTSTTNFILNGGTFNAGSYTNTAGTLSLTSGSTIVVNGAQLTFANSSAQIWTGTLTINGTIVNGSTIQFGTDDTGLTSAQLADIVFTGIDAGDVATLDSNGFLDATAVPEPSTVMLLVLGVVGLLYAGRFRGMLLRA